MSINNIGICILSVGLLAACSHSSDTNDKIIARSGDNNLMLSDLKTIIPSGSSKADSNFIIQNYTDKWLKNQILLKEAQNAKVLNMNKIEAKTLDYKNALLIYEYQKSLIVGKLDTAISDQEYKMFYASHAKDFELKQNIVKGIVIKVKGKATGLRYLSYELKNGKDLDKMKKSIVAYCNQYASQCSLETDNWLSFEALAKASPFTRIQNKTDWLSKNNIAVAEEDGSAFLIKIFECKLENRISPLDYVKEQIKSIILNSRKVKLLAQYEEEIYKKALSEKQIEKFN